MKKDFTADTGTVWKHYLLGAVIGVIIIAAALAIFSAVILFLEMDRIYAPAFATVALSLGAFFASRYAAKKIGKKGYLTGLIMGLLFFCVVTLFALIFDGDGGGFTTVFRLIIVTLASLIGGISGVKKDKKKKNI